MGLDRRGHSARARIQSRGGSGRGEREKDDKMTYHLRRATVWHDSNGGVVKRGVVFRENGSTKVMARRLRDWKKKIGWKQSSKK